MYFHFYDIVFIHCAWQNYQKSCHVIFIPHSTSIISKMLAKKHPHSFKPSAPISRPLTLSNDASIKLLLTTTNSGKPRKPHQAFLTLTSPTTGLSDAYPLSVKDSGKSVLTLSFKDIPTQLLTSVEPLDAEVVIGSFGSSTPYKGLAFKLKVDANPNTPLPKGEEQVRYGSLKEIHHQFRENPKSPPKIITLVFLGGVLASLPLLLGAWIALGGNLNHLSTALGAAPISHALFVGSVLAMEAVFFLYYTTWNLFETLPVAGVIGVVAFYSGSKALSEVQERRLKGLR
jgi:oligosaccharyltransferase complex subunit delta (ribophorin II)